MHDIVKCSWLTRHDELIRTEETARRKGRPPSKKEVELKALKVQEAEEYRAGIGPLNVKIYFLELPLTTTLHPSPRGS
jgi:translation machinery-associated protein 16